MATYIILANYTDQGIRNVKDSPNRADAARKKLQDMGGDMTAFYLTMGGYDIVAICEAPGDEDAVKFALELGSLGNVRTTTLKAFPESDYRRIIQAMA